jgi:hypothetical protein
MSEIKFPVKAIAVSLFDAEGHIVLMRDAAAALNDAQRMREQLDVALLCLQSIACGGVADPKWYAGEVLDGIVATMGAALAPKEGA